MKTTGLADGYGGSEALETLSQRLKQDRDKIQDVETRLSSIENDIKAERRQYLELADIHKFQDIDQHDFAVIVREDKIQTDKARNYQLGAWASLIFGTLVSSGLSVLVFDFAAPFVVFVCGAIASLLIGAVVVYTMMALIDPSPRTPQAIKTVKLSVLVFGLVTLLSAALFSWLRFMEEAAVISLLSTSIAGFEIGVFGLTGSFECGERIYNWSKKSHERVKSLTVLKKARELEHATLTVNVQELEYRLKKEQEKLAPAAQETSKVEV